ncbi:MAG: hypothetical protein NC122_04830 [Faecalibacterium sp.]|nr:hypothetical protein [Ruminococcus sp.]MCM1391522.1 hypothetical protein [Ruminococcus sp.]MCM1485510.1 hypothetical protein [Faecalibacterium sp.]
MHISRKRNHRIHFRYGEDEKQIMDKLQSETGLSKSEIVRFLILYTRLIEVPHIDFEGIGNLANQIGKQVNQIVHEAYQQKFINPKEIQTLFPLLEKLETDIDASFNFDKWYAYQEEINGQI